MIHLGELVKIRGMDIELEITPGRYVLAVSGGIDSVVLLNKLALQPGVELTVAHFDHGIRDDSPIDRKFVSELAGSLKLPFVYEEGKLGAGTSEAVARKARYDFLLSVQKVSGAKGLVTAHHQDDLLETVIINLLRGTGRKGLSPMLNSSLAHRPLLKVSKQQIVEYAKNQGLNWREDSTNQDTSYLRNYVRHKILTRFSDDQRRRLLTLIMNSDELNKEIDACLAECLRSQASAYQMDRDSFVMLPHSVAKEVLAAWLRDQGLRDFDSKLLEHLVIAAKIAPSGKYADVNNRLVMHIGTDKLALMGRDR